MLDGYDHLKWHQCDDVTARSSWKETLFAMCASYGTFCGRWHSNQFWALTKTQIPDMTEEQCQQKVIDIEREADSELWYWKMMQ